MDGWLPVMVCLPFILLLILSGVWSARRFKQLEQLPGHFGFDGKATHLAPRRTMVWLLPVTLSTVLMAVAVAMVLTPREMQNGNPVTAAVVCGFVVLAAQALVLWLNVRWAREHT
ncbi:hypothetical protein [Pontixanthobacter sp.]|uniref:hypothetical protein n=1 Tax=Pontixanthobacter sp. TaxID=2792078 RepID=UPI003C7E4832